MSTKTKLASIQARIRENVTELDAEILRTEERLIALKMLKEARSAEEKDIGAAIEALP